MLLLLPLTYILFYHHCLIHFIIYLIIQKLSWKPYFLLPTINDQRKNTLCTKPGCKINLHEVTIDESQEAYPSCLLRLVSYCKL